MLTIRGIFDLGYYEESYYHSRGEPQGIWAGLAKHLVQLKNVVTATDFLKIFRGYGLDNSKLCNNAGSSHRLGWDLTFSAPKSLSIIWAISDTDTRSRIDKAQHRAVLKALSFIERHSALTRRGHQGKYQERVSGLIAALFEHCTSRELDPQLHTHCLIANIAPREDNSWGSLNSQHLFLWQKATGSIYRASLAASLREIGFQIDTSECGELFEVRGIPKDVKEYYSKRAQSIKSKLEQLDISSSASKIGDILKLTTRSHKKKTDRKKLLNKWQHELKLQGVTDQLIKKLITHQPPTPSPLPLIEIMEKVVQKQSCFRLQDLYEITSNLALEHFSGLAEIENAVRIMIKKEACIPLGKDFSGNLIFTTSQALEKEKKLAKLAKQLQQQSNYCLNEKIINKAVKEQNNNQGFSLSDEQTEGVYSLCQGGLEILQGAAGAGKSVSLRAVKSAYESVGFSVLGATVSRQAANQLHSETTIQSITVAKLLIDLKNGTRNLKNTILIVDEAGQISSYDLLSLLEPAHSHGGKVILVGEEQQMDAITHGGSLRFLSQQHNYHSIKKIRRQREPWAREAVQHLRNGNALCALKAHQRRGLLHFEQDSLKTKEKLVREWFHFCQSNPDKQTMIVAQRWKDVIKLSKLVRQIYQSNGSIGKENIEATCTVSNQIMKLSFSSGDRVRFTRNDYQRNFTNGQQGTIEKVEESGEDIVFQIKCDNGQAAHFRLSSYCDDKSHLYLVHAYATTVYSSQGMTINGDVFVYGTSNMDRSSAYVAGSRHKDNCHWYFNAQEIDSLTAKTFDSEIPLDQLRLRKISQYINRNKTNTLAIERYLALDKNLPSKEVAPIKRLGKQFEAER